MSGIIADGPDAVRMYRLIVMKSAVKLESKGLKSRLGSVRAKACKEFKLKPRTPHAEVIARIQQEIDAMAAAGVRFTSV